MSPSILKIGGAGPSGHGHGRGGTGTQRQGRQRQRPRPADGQGPLDVCRLAVRHPRAPAGRRRRGPRAHHRRIQRRHGDDPGRRRRPTATTASTELYKNPDFGSHTQPPILHGDHFYSHYTINERSDGLVAMSMDGQVKWKTDQQPPFVRGGTILADGLLLMTDGDTKLYLVEPSPSAFKPLASAVVLEKGDNWAPLALVDGKLLIRGQKQMKACRSRGEWRRGWDSNPRYRFRHGGFQDRCLQPLGHLSQRGILAPSLPAFCGCLDERARSGRSDDDRREDTEPCGRQIECRPGVPCGRVAPGLRRRRALLPAADAAAAAVALPLRCARLGAVRRHLPPAVVSHHPWRAPAAGAARAGHRPRLRCGRPRRRARLRQRRKAGDAPDACRRAPPRARI